MSVATTRKTIQSAVDDYFSGKITVDEAFRRAYGTPPGNVVEIPRRVTNAPKSPSGAGKKQKVAKSRSKSGKR